MKRYLAILLAIAMLSCLLAGCGANDQPQQNVPQTNPVVETTEAPTEPETTAAPTEAPTEAETTYPWTVEDSFYYFYDYETGEYIYSDVKTYHCVTGGVALFSTLDFGFLSDENYEYIAPGYDESYAVFIYEFDNELLTQYKEYLVSIGYEYVQSETYNQGTSHYYKNPSNGFMFDLFVGTNASGEATYVAIEPYVNGAMQ